MPELPEVETVVTGLRPHLSGRRIVAVSHLDWPPMVRPLEPEAFRQALLEAEVAAVSRRAKYIIISLRDGGSIIGHLRMTGQLIYRERATAPGRFTHVVIQFDDGSELHFDDQRKFGRLRYVAPDESLAAALPDLGPEPLDDDFTADAFAALIANKAQRGNPRIKQALLDQRVLSGLGNIYADETLHLARVHPLRPIRSLSRAELDRIYAAFRHVLQQGIANKGTTFSDYRDAFGEHGSNQYLLRVYQRTGQPCPECATPIERIVVGGRGTHFCPNCQLYSPTK